MAALLGGSQSAFDAVLRGDRVSGEAGTGHTDASLGDHEPRDTTTADALLTEDSPPPPRQLPLHEACYEGDLKRVKGLLRKYSTEYDAEPDKRTELINELSAGDQGFPPLHAAVLSGSDKIVSALLEAGAKVDIPSADGLSALQVAVGAGELACTRLLIDAGAAINLPPLPRAAAALKGNRGEAKSNGGTSAASGVAWVDGGVSILHTACAAGHSTIVKLMLERGASPWAVLSDPKQRGATPLAVAAQTGHAECVALLLDEKLVNIAPAPPPPQSDAGTAGKPPAPPPLATAGKANKATNVAKPAAVAKTGPTKAPLTPSNGQSIAAAPQQPNATADGVHLAGEPLVVRLVATPMADGRTPLHLACEHGATEATGLLITTLRSAHASIDATDAAGLSPLDRACQSGHVACAKLLLEAGAAWRRKGAKGGSSALHVAVSSGESACIATLLEAKADLEQRDSSGRTPLLLACELGHTECTLALLSARHLDTASLRAAIRAAERADKPDCSALVQRALVLWEERSRHDSKGLPATSAAGLAGLAPSLTARLREEWTAATAEAQKALGAYQLRLDKQ